MWWLKKISNDEPEMEFPADAEVPDSWMEAHLADQLDETLNRFVRQYRAANPKARKAA